MLKINNLINFALNNTDKLLFLAVAVFAIILSDTPPGNGQG